MSRIVYDIMFNTSVGNTPTLMDPTTSTSYIEEGEDWFTFHAYSSSCCTIYTFIGLAAMKAVWLMGEQQYRDRRTADGR